MLPLTIVQLQALFGFGARPVRARLPRVHLGGRAVVVAARDPFAFLRPRRGVRRPRSSSLARGRWAASFRAEPGSPTAHARQRLARRSGGRRARATRRATVPSPRPGSTQAAADAGRSRQAAGAVRAGATGRARGSTTGRSVTPRATNSDDAERGTPPADRASIRRPASRRRARTRRCAIANGVAMPVATLRQAHVPARRRPRDDVGHQRPVDREEHAARRRRTAPRRRSRPGRRARAPRSPTPTAPIAHAA